MAEFVTVGTSDQIGESGATAFRVGDLVVGVARVGDELLAFSDVCTHQLVQLDLPWRDRRHP